MRNLFHLLEKVARESAQKIAIIREEKSYTYEQYYEYSIRIAAGILARYPEDFSPIIIKIKDSEYELFAFMACLALGRMYIPISASVTAEKIREIQAKSGAKLILDEEKIKEILERYPRETIRESNSLNASTFEIENTFKTTIRESHPFSTAFSAMALLTSGSTGEPKLCAKIHESIYSMCEIFTDTFAFTSADVFANQISLAFDGSLKNIYLSLFNQATLLMISPSDFLTPVRVLDLLELHKASVFICTVYALRLLERFDALSYKRLASLRSIMFSGEKIPANTLQYWQKHIQARYINLYAPTEYSFNLTYHIIDQDTNYDNIPIGELFPCADILIIDEDLNELAQGEEGEILIAGAGLSLGYLGDDELTAEKFLPSSQISASRGDFHTYYRTGDYGYLGADGLYYILGRKDNQIKHCGYRIELEELDMALLSIDFIEEAACIYDEKSEQILAVVKSELNENEIKTAMARVLPKYKRARKIIKRASLPKTLNGKIDRNRLKKELI